MDVPSTIRSGTGRDMAFDTIIVDLPVVYQVDGKRKRQKTEGSFFDVMETMPFPIRSCTEADLEETYHITENRSGAETARKRKLVVADGRAHVEVGAEHQYRRVPVTLDVLRSNAAWRVSDKQKPHDLPLMDLKVWRATLTRYLQGKVYAPSHISEVWSTNRDDAVAAAVADADGMLLVDGVLHTSSFEPVIHLDRTMGIVFLHATDWVSEVELLRQKSKTMRLLAPLSDAPAIAAVLGADTSVPIHAGLMALPWRFPAGMASIHSITRSLVDKVLSRNRQTSMFVGGSTSINKALDREASAAACRIHPELRAVEDGVAYDEASLIEGIEIFVDVARKCGDYAEWAQLLSDKLRLLDDVRRKSPSIEAAIDTKEDAVFRL
jgi:hypothetical protein